MNTFMFSLYFQMVSQIGELEVIVAFNGGSENHRSFAELWNYQVFC